MDSTKDYALLVHGKDNPALVPSGYGKTVKYIAPRLQQAGYDLKVFATVGHDWNTMHWEDPFLGEELEILGGGEGPYGENFIGPHLERLQAETEKTPLLFFIGDAHALNHTPQALDNHDILGLAWGAVDWEKPTPENVLQRFRPWQSFFSMSQHGHQVLQDDQPPLDNLRDPVWLGVNPDMFQPLPHSELDATRQSMGFREDTFNIVSVFANQYQRKGEYEMFKGLADFTRKHPDKDIRFFGMTQVRRDWDLDALAEHLGIRDIVTFSNDYDYKMGNYYEQDICRMLNAADVAVNLGYEGFGLTTIEAQACNTPVIGFNAAATPELHKAGVLVEPDKKTMLKPMITRYLPSADNFLQALETCYGRWERDDEWPDTRDWIVENFHWDVVADNVLDRLDETVQRITDQELSGPPTPGERAQQLAEQQVVVERDQHPADAGGE